MSGIYEGEKQGEAEQAAAPAIVVPEYGGGASTAASEFGGGTSFPAGKATGNITLLGKRVEANTLILAAAALLVVLVVRQVIVSSGGSDSDPNPNTLPANAKLGAAPLAQCMAQLALHAQVGKGAPQPMASYLFDGVNGKANDASGANHGTVAGAPTSVRDHLGVTNGAYRFDGVDDVITLDIPFAAADDDFSIAMWLKPSLMDDGDWHAFAGHHGDDNTRSPTLMISNGVCDVGFCDCSGNEGGLIAWEGGAGPHGWVIQPAGGLLPDGECDPDPEQTHKCQSAGCCDCSGANKANSGDGVAANGMHWDTRTVQTENGNNHGGLRFAGTVDNYFTLNRYTHIVWSKAGQVCKFYKNGGLTDTGVCPTHVDLHDTYEIGHVDIFWFQGVIDEVSFFSYGKTSLQTVNDLVGCFL